MINVIEQIIVAVGYWFAVGMILLPLIAFLHTIIKHIMFDGKQHGKLFN